jgi:hypothetical protein
MRLSMGTRREGLLPHATRLDSAQVPIPCALYALPGQEAVRSTRRWMVVPIQTRVGFRFRSHVSA